MESNTPWFETGYGEMGLTLQNYPATPSNPLDRFIIADVMYVNYTLGEWQSRCSAECIATGYGLNEIGAGVQVPVRLRIFTFPYRPDWL
jgi:hypothetical protein